MFFSIELFSVLDNIIVFESFEKILELIGILQLGSNTILIGFFPSTSLVVSIELSSIIVGSAGIGLISFIWMTISGQGWNE